MPWRVAEHLHLDVPRLGEVTLDVHPVVAESGLRGGPGPRRTPAQLARGAHHRHPRPPPPAAAFTITG